MFKNTNKINKSLVLLILAVAFIGSAFSCSGGNNSQQTTLQLWKPFDSTDDWQPIIEAYQKQNKNIKIVFTKKSSETYERDLLEAMAAGQGPDIFSVQNDSLANYYNKIQPAPENIIQLRTLKDNFLDVVYEDMVVNSKLWALPSYVDVLVLYYNKDILASNGIARAPETWPELIEMVPKLTVIKDNTIQQSAIAIGTTINVNRPTDILKLLMLQSGVDFYDASLTRSNLATGTVNDAGDAPAVRAAKFYTQFADPSSKAYTWNNLQKNSIDSFSEGKTAMMFGYGYLRPLIESKSPFLNYALADAPQISMFNTKENLASYWAETVWTGSPNKLAAWDFILFATNYNNNKLYTEKTNQPSSRRDLIAEQQRTTSLGVLADNALTAKTVLKPDNLQFEQILTDIIDDITLNGLTAIEAVSRASTRLNLLIKEKPLKP